MTAELILEDGTRFPAVPFGTRRSTAGEVVFNTGMVGYGESMTDPSYAGQILVITYPLVGNYGVPVDSSDGGSRPPEFISPFFESDRIHVRGLVVSSLSERFSHWSALDSLEAWMVRHGIPGLRNVDTRALTKRLREKGCMLGKTVVGDEEVAWDDPSRRNMVAEVSIRQRVVYPGSGERRVIVVDLGCKHNIIRSLLERGVSVVRVPWDYDWSGEDADGVILSNGPGRSKGVREDHLGGEEGHGAAACRSSGSAWGTSCSPRGRGGHLQAEVRSSRAEPAVHRGRDATMLHHIPEPRLRQWTNDLADRGWRSGSSMPMTGPMRGSATLSPALLVRSSSTPKPAPGPTDTDHLFDAFVELARCTPPTVVTSSLLGSGALKIGEAGEFDYSGSQALKALKEEGITTVLVNPNIATIQTSEGLADKVYLLPVNPDFVERVIEQEKPDGILIGFGGQTALNCGMDLADARRARAPRRPGSGHARSRPSRTPKTASCSSAAARRSASTSPLAARSTASTERAWSPRETRLSRHGPDRLRPGRARLRACCATRRNSPSASRRPSRTRHRS